MPGLYTLPELEHLRVTGFSFHKWDRFWVERYCELAQFYAQHGHLRVRATRPLLGAWLSGQRQHQDKGKLSPDQQRALNHLGFIWNTKEEKWRRQYERYRNYVSTHHPAGQVVINWLTIQRHRWDKLSEHQQNLLLQCGFKKNPIGYCRTTNLYDLETFFRQKGHLRGLPNRLRKFSELMLLFHSQGRLDPAYKIRLDRLGFAWTEPRPVVKLAVWWEKRYAELVAHLQATSFRAPVFRPGEKPRLAKWLRRQREPKKWKRLSESQKQKLTELGLAPGATKIKAWEAKYQKAIVFLQERGESAFWTHPQGRWVRGQKERWANLAAWQRRKLEKLSLRAFSPHSPKAPTHTSLPSQR